MSVSIPKKTWFSVKFTFIARGRAHCKIVRKYCIFGCSTHFGHITASPYAKWLNTDSASYGSLVAAASLNTRSIQLQTPCDLSRGSALLPGTKSPVNEGRNLDDEINAQAAVILVCMAIPPWSMRVIVGSALCLWINFAYFFEEWQWFIWTESLRTHIWKNNRSPYQSGQREIAYHAKLIKTSMIISGQSTEDTIPNMESETTQCAESNCLRVSEFT